MKKLKSIIVLLFFTTIVASAQVIFPDLIDPSNSGSVFAWWQFIYMILTPIGIYFFGKFFPSSSKSELIIKSTSIAVVVLLIILGVKGYTLMGIGQALVALIGQVFFYDKVLNPLGFNTEKTKSYK